jgi:hypothetical protein
MTMLKRVRRDVISNRLAVLAIAVQGVMKAAVNLVLFLLGTIFA